MMYYPEETRVTPLTTIRRERLLPARGQVLVQPGELVGPADVVARCQLPGEIRVIDVSRALGVRRELAARYIRKAEGNAVQAGEILAAPGGLLGRLRRACRAPADGQVMTVRSGLVLIEEAATTFELVAHLKGQVANVMPNLGVVISTVGSLIQGVWGSGGEAEGILKVLVDSPQKPLRAHAIDVSCHGTVVVGGRILDEKALEQAVEAKVRGVIAGSVNADLRPLLQSLPFPVMITEGFGSLPISQPIFSLLHSNMGREVMLSADVETRWGARRPELVIPLRAEQTMPKEEAGPLALQVGMQVRVLRAPYMGALGTVADLPQLPQTVESGARLRVAEVNLGNGATDTIVAVQIPLANLELIR
jgi:uncharacterized membrane protein YvlD (DUF360 family)